VKPLNMKMVGASTGEVAGVGARTTESRARDLGEVAIMAPLFLATMPDLLIKQTYTQRGFKECHSK
jgi:hypothetical protein